MSFAISQWHTWLLYPHSWLNTLHTLPKLFRFIYLHIRFYSFAAPILQTRGCQTMFSYSWTSRSHMLKNFRGHNEDSGGVNLTPRNPWKSQFSKTLSALATQSRTPPPSSDCDELQEPTPQRTIMKLSVKPKRKTDGEYKNEADDDFCSPPQQPSQPAHHSLEENLLNKEEDASISNYQLDLKPSRCHTSLEGKQIDLEILKEKNQNLGLRQVMKLARNLSGPEKSSILTQFDRSSGPKMTKSIIA